MQGLDDIDRALIARLREDGRASISALAQEIHVARGTAQSRLDRLLAAGIIRRFTIDIDPDYEKQTVRAITLIHLQGTSTKPAAQAISRIPEVVELYATNGRWDLVAELRTGNLEDLDRALVDLRGVRGVENTETSILLRTL